MMEERLKYIYSSISELLRFAEAKNAMIIAFNSASIYGISQIYNLKAIEDYSFFKIYLLISVIFLIFSTVIGLISFAPRVKIVKGGYFAPKGISNVLFFEYLKGKTNIEILKEVNDLKEDASFSTFEKDIAEQIKQISLIASKKYTYFTIAVWLTIGAYITFPLAGVFCAYTYLRD